MFNYIKRGTPTPLKRALRQLLKDLTGESALLQRTKKLERTLRTLRKRIRELAQRTQERTKELEQRIDELQVTVFELKPEIEQRSDEIERAVTKFGGNRSEGLLNRSQFVERITPEAMRTRFADIYENRPDIRVLLHIINVSRILEWVHSVGVVQEEELRAFVPPFPPPELRGITAAEELEMFLWTGLVNISQIMTLYEENRSTSDPSCPRILDFGCGCGRMSRFLNDGAHRWSAYACDVNASHVDWCIDNLKGIQTTRNSILPPSPYRDQMFNLVYSLSVFTHLPEESANQWLSEIHRILAPNGLLILTTHGLPALEIIKDSEVHQRMFNLDRNDVMDMIVDLKERPFGFCKYDQDTLRLAQAGEEYGSTFIHPKYIYENWESEKFEVLRHMAGGLLNWQDIVILRRR